jgi:peptidoglycan hydrolase-like protein with peptidoglycan-binding domain
MKQLILLPLALLLFAPFTWADDQLRNAQTELRSLGFYYGEVDGRANAETTAALRRYQIRNGLEVTGDLNKETLGALGMGTKKSTAPAITPPTPAPVEKKQAPVNLRRQETIEDSDRDFLRREETKPRTPDAVAPLAPAASPNAPRDASIIDPPAPLEPPSADYPVLFAGTPYGTAPLSVQQQALRRAQSVLAGRGFYRDIVDGLPGPSTEEALLTFQRANRLTLTGRLDLETLGELRLLPNPTNYSDAGGFRASRTLRGIWIERR